jgi:hypothetical protein
MQLAGVVPGLPDKLEYWGPTIPVRFRSCKEPGVRPTQPSKTYALVAPSRKKLRLGSLAC